MFRRFRVILIPLLLFAAACSNDAEPTEAPRPSSSTSSTTSTLPPTTTTTTPPLRIEGAPKALTSIVDRFYAYAADKSTNPPPMPAKVRKAMPRTAGTRPTRGVAHLGTFQDLRLAVVEMKKDVFLAVKDGSGWRIVAGRWPSLDVPAYFGGAPRIVAVVGTDARPGQSVADSRADSIHFVALDGKGAGAVVGVPRDSYVPVPGFGRRKITTSLSLGGPDAMMETFEDLTGLPFEGYVMTGFSGFESLAGDVLGGVSVDVPISINDQWAHVALAAGRQILNGAQALGFARARKTVPRGDFTRSEHQGLILLGAVGMVKDMGISMIPGLLERSEPYLLSSLTPQELFTFSYMALSTNLERVSNVVAPGSSGSAGSASVVYLSSSADELWSDLADGRLEN